MECDCDDCMGIDDCDHQDYEADILTGIAMCGRCGFRWMQSAKEIEREREAAMAYDKHCEGDGNEWRAGSKTPVGDDIPF